VIPAIISQALEGSEIRLGSLWPRRDYTFVKDVVSGFVKAGEKKEILGKEINLGSVKR